MAARIVSYTPESLADLRQKYAVTLQALAMPVPSEPDQDSTDARDRHEAN